MDTTFKDLSYNISCEHIKYLNNKYNNDNDLLYKRQITCNDTDNDNENNKNVNYVDSIYVSKKTCIYKSTEPDELKWTSSFQPINNKTDLTKRNEINDKITFNENTRRKIVKSGSDYQYQYK
jgi:hypothetical protein